MEAILNTRDQKMIFYFIRKYSLILIIMIIGLSGLTILLGIFSWQESISRAIFWGGLFSVLQVYREFRYKNLWPVFDSLQISKYWLLGSASAFSTFLSFGIQLWLLK